MLALSGETLSVAMMIGDLAQTNPFVFDPDQ
jgi:hypothetical protein